MEISRDEIRVMTVHGAKGLEASVVFLVDTTSSPTDTQRLRLIHVPHGDGEIVVWAGRKADDPQTIAAARAAMLKETEDEYRRLLYVAMTRAADRLVIGGCMPGNMNNVRGGSWYDLMGRGLDAAGLQVEVIETEDGPVKRYARAEDIAETAGDEAQHMVETAVALPGWLRTPAAEAPVDLAVLRPSDPSADERPVRAGEALAARSLAMQRGTLVHRLLQSLPDVLPERRRDAALRYLGRNAAEWPEVERERLAGRVLAVTEDPRFAAVFSPGSRAEVSIVGRLALAGQPPALVSGQIDRLVVTEAEVLIVDFKTNQQPPSDLADVPPAYVRQLALYRAVLRQLYPGRAVRAALLWTEAPQFMELPASALDAALPSQHV
jgi:ATP-dependent helicase/nuclease subunit A